MSREELEEEQNDHDSEPTGHREHDEGLFGYFVRYRWKRIPRRHGHFSNFGMGGHERRGLVWQMASRGVNGTIRRSGRQRSGQRRLCRSGRRKGAFRRTYAVRLLVR